MSVLDDKLYVVTSCFNPLRYSSRWRLYNEFAHRVKCAGAELMTVEVAFGDRPFVVTEPGNPMNLQLRTNSEIWMKEVALNLGVQRLPDNWKYVSWLDADVDFMRNDWVLEARQQLQHDPVIQMFSTAYDLSFDKEIYQEFKGFAYCYRNKIERLNNLQEQTMYYGKYWHPGFAWAATREAWNALGGLIDYSLLGSGDMSMACALVGHYEWSLPTGLSPGYYESIKIWQDRADRWIRGRLGYMQGGLIHHFHGKKQNRRYRERWSLIKKHKYDVETDLKRDWQGLWAFAGNKPELERDCYGYFFGRREDDR